MARALLPPRPPSVYVWLNKDGQSDNDGADGNALSISFWFQFNKISLFVYRVKIIHCQYNRKNDKFKNKVQRNWAVVPGTTIYHPVT